LHIFRIKKSPRLVAPRFADVLLTYRCTTSRATSHPTASAWKRAADSGKVRSLPVLHLEPDRGPGPTMGRFPPRDFPEDLTPPHNLRLVQNIWGPRTAATLAMRRQRECSRPPLHEIAARAADCLSHVPSRNPQYTLS
jgi:hypothetical protein